METKHFLVRGKSKRCRTYLKNEFLLDTTDDWIPKLGDQTFLNKIGITAPPTTILVAHSGSAKPTDDGKIGGIDIIRLDLDDAPAGKYNWDHYDVCLLKNDEAVLVLSENKRQDHWYPTIKKWFERITDKPLHLDELDYDIEEIE